MSGKLSQSSSQIVLRQPRTSLAKHDEEKERRILISSYLDKFGAIANRVATPQVRQIFEEGLSDLSPSRLRAGLEGWLRNGDRFPWPSDIRHEAEL